MYAKPEALRPQSGLIAIGVRSLDVRPDKQRGIRMTNRNFRAILALIFGLAISATIGHTVLAATGSGGKYSVVRQTAAEDASDSGDDLVLPELDRPASKKSSTDRSSAPAQTGSVDRQSSAPTKRAANAKVNPRLAARDELDPAPESANRVTRPAPRNAYPPAAEYPGVARNPNRYAATQSGAYLSSPPNGGPRYASSYPPGYPQSRGGRPTSAMYYDRGGPADRQPMRVAQNAPGPIYPEYRPGMRMANRFNEPTPAAPAVPAPEGAESAGPESITPGHPVSPDNGGDLYGPYGDEYGGCSECGGHSDCGGECCNPCCFQRGSWFAGVELLVLRPTSSENVAFQKEVSVTDDVSSQVNTVVQRDWGYKGSFRTFVGYRLCDCCEEIRFTYWNYSNSARQLSGVVPVDGSTAFTGQLEINALNPGDRLLANNQLLMNTYDIDYAKCICYGQCDPCNPCCACPPWGLKYYVGIRIADVQRGDASQVSNPEEGVTAQSFIDTHFVGAGPRVGLEGRRFFGCDQCWSLYARSNFALILGQFDIDERASNSQSSSGTFVHQSYHDSHDRVIPMTEIELGGNWQINCRWNLSAGYTWQAWWDLGAFEQGANTFQEPIDTSNILGLDGLFARLEYCF